MSPSNDGPRHPHPRSLTAREAQAIELRGRGLTNRQIAATWGVSVGSVASTLANARRKRPIEVDAQ